MRKLSDTLGNASMFLSLLCAIHCAATPIIIGIVSLMGVSFMMDPFWEVCLLVVSNVLAIFALATAYKKHRKIGPFILFGLSLVLIIIGLLIAQHSLILAGLVFTAIALLLNRKYSHQTASCATK